MRKNIIAATSHGAVVVYDGSIFDGAGGYGFTTSGGKLIINGGTFYGHKDIYKLDQVSGLRINSGDVVINGGTFIGNNFGLFVEGSEKYSLKLSGGDTYFSTINPETYNNILNTGCSFDKEFKLDSKNLFYINQLKMSVVKAGSVIKYYSVKFYGNGAGSGRMSDITGIKYGVSKRLTANKFKRTGYTFGGWNTKANGTQRQMAVERCMLTNQV